jgi:hypothetical protein
MEALELLRLNRLSADEVRRLTTLDADAIRGHLDRQQQTLETLKGVLKMEQLHEAIEDVKARLSQVDSELETVGQDLDPLDGKAAQQAVVRKSKLTQERETLILRLPALEQAIKESERTAAKSRVAAIGTELSDLAVQGATDVARCSILLTELKSLVRAAGERRRQYHTLMDEARYVSLAHDLDTPCFPGLPLPSRENAEGFARLVRESVTASTNNEWSWKLNQLRERGKTEARLTQSKAEIKIDGVWPSDGEVLRQEEERRAQERKRNTLPRAVNKPVNVVYGLLHPED